MIDPSHVNFKKNVFPFKNKNLLEFFSCIVLDWQRASFASWGFSFHV